MAREGFGARLARRIGLVALGIVLALLVSEALLQAGAWVVRLRGEPAATASGGRRRIICIGDSNTYGLYLERTQAYPAVLQQRWNAEPGLGTAEILNLGVPGTNSSKLRSNLPRLLHAFQPDAVLIMIGANDAWTVPVPLEEGVATRAQWLWSRSRVFRLLYMLRRAVQDRRADVSVDFVPPGQPQPAKGVVRIGDEEIDLGYTGRAAGAAGWPDELRTNLQAMLDQVRGAAARPILVTYPSGYDVYGSANQVIRAVAAASGTALIDPAAALGAACPTGACPELFLPDHHATARGNEIVADTVLRGLTAAPPGS